MTTRLLAHLSRLLAGVVALSATCTHAAAQTYAVHAGRVITAAADGPYSYAPGIIIVRDGRIATVGDADTEVPAGMPVVRLPDATIMPGIVSAVSSVAPDHGGAESIGAAFVAADAFDRFADFRRTLAGGVTTVHASPGDHRLLTGRGSVVRLAGAPDSRILRREADLSVTLGGRANNAPNAERRLIPPIPEQAIEPALRQRPGARISQAQSLQDAIERAVGGRSFVDEGSQPDRWALHARALRNAWQGGLPVRVQADRAEDIRTALGFLRSSDRAGYVVGGREAAEAADLLEGTNVPLVYTLDARFDNPADAGVNPRALDPSIEDLAHFAEAIERGDIRLALARVPGAATQDLRLAAALATRAGLSERRVIEAITRVPAEVLGVGDRVGSLQPGRDADFVVLAGDPLGITTVVERVVVTGRTVYDYTDEPEPFAIEQAQETGEPDLAGGTVVVRAGTVWLSPGNEIRDGEVLIEDGRVTEIGRRVAQPPGARVVDAGPDAFVTPGLIDAYGHLGLEGDRGAPGTEVELTSLVSTPDALDQRVAGSGITTTIRAPYRVNRNGSRLAAVKTAGRDREARVVREVAALAFDVTGEDPSAIAERLKKRIESARAYFDKWTEYRAKHKAWREAMAKGEAVAGEPQTEELAAETSDEGDPVTGTWEMTVTAQVFPEPLSGPVGLNLDGDEFEGRLLSPAAADIEHRIVGTLDGNSISGRLEIETGQPGFPEFTGELDGETFAGSMTFLGLEAQLEGTRTDSNRVEFKVKGGKRRTTGKDGEPLPPPLEPDLEPIRAVLEARAPVLVRARSASEIRAALALLTDEYGFRVVLRGAEGAPGVQDTIDAEKVGVVLAGTGVRSINRRPYNQGADLERRGVNIAFQSQAEDGARDLPLSALYAVSRGLSPDAALAAMTTEPATMFQMEDRVGAIAPGMDGDLVVFSGHPFDPSTRVERVIVNGRVVHDSREDDQ